jgi:betaine lipid synthase
VDERNYLLGGIPYYIFLGSHRQIPFSTTDLLESVDASCTESPYLSPKQHRAEMSLAVETTGPVEIRSKAYQSAIINLSANLPLPSTFYQNHQRRIYYNDQLKKHTQFNNDYLYAFTWEDPRVDQRLLKIDNDDVVLCLTSGGDNLPIPDGFMPWI